MDAFLGSVCVSPCHRMIREFSFFAPVICIRNSHYSFIYHQREKYSNTTFVQSSIVWLSFLYELKEDDRKTFPFHLLDFVLVFFVGFYMLFLNLLNLGNNIKFSSCSLKYSHRGISYPILDLFLSRYNKWSWYQLVFRQEAPRSLSSARLLLGFCASECE